MLQRVVSRLGSTESLVHGRALSASRSTGIVHNLLRGVIAAAGILRP